MAVGYGRIWIRLSTLHWIDLGQLGVLRNTTAQSPGYMAPLYDNRAFTLSISSDMKSTSGAAVSENGLISVTSGVYGALEELASNTAVTKLVIAETIVSPTGWVVVMLKYEMPSLNKSYVRVDAVNNYGYTNVVAPIEIAGSGTTGVGLAGMAWVPGEEDRTLRLSYNQLNLSTSQVMYEFSMPALPAVPPAP
jgi:hypothetical protein